MSIAVLSRFSGNKSASKGTLEFEEMIDALPTAVMACDPKDLRVIYMNKRSRETLKEIEHLLPVKSDDVLGQCIDVFHKHPEHQRRMLSDPSNLPHRALIKLGEETLELNVSALNDANGDYLAPMLTWNLVTENIALAGNVTEVAEAVSSASEQMASTSKTMQESVTEANARAGAVASAAEQPSSSVDEISRQVTHSADIANGAAEEANRASEMIEGLNQAAQKIGDVVGIIQDIAGQTNLLALNATIEAARAGDAGKGFAVVASEVKSLANQTAGAAEEISAQISAIQGATKAAVDANGVIAKTITEIHEVATAIASAVEEQGAATQEVSSNIAQVTEASETAGQAANEVLDASSDLAKKSTELQSYLDAFMKNMGAT